MKSNKGKSNKEMREDKGEGEGEGEWKSGREKKPGKLAELGVHSGCGVKTLAAIWWPTPALFPFAFSSCVGEHKACFNSDYARRIF